MRRKSERMSKKTKTSPEKKIEKPKRGRTSRRRKQSSSSDNESVGESSPAVVIENVEQIDKKSPVKQPISVEEESPEEKQDQVWQVKTSEGSGDSGEIQKLKICLARPSSTPERVDKSPRSKRKHSRTTSSSDTAAEVTDDKNKKKHRSKRNTKESKEDLDKSFDSQGDDTEKDQTEEVEIIQIVEEQNDEAEPESNSVDDDVPMSTTSEEQKEPEEQKAETVSKAHSAEVVIDNNDSLTKENEDAKALVADTTVDSSITDPQESQTEVNTTLEIQEKSHEHCTSIENKDDTNTSVTVPDHTEDSNGHKSDTEQKDLEDKTHSTSESTNQIQQVDKSEKQIIVENTNDDVKNTVSPDREINNQEDQSLEIESSQSSPKKINREDSIDSYKDIDSHKAAEKKENDSSNFTQSLEDTSQNGQPTPLVIKRKRRWGTRPSKMTQCPTISTEILKDIIPDVKPVEFEEVIDKKKHKKEIDTVERPILPKIIIDNTDQIEQRKREQEQDEKENIKIKGSQSLSNRKISIVKENDTILTRPPSPPRHKSSNILYITNLVRPFTLAQLKNLLQRTGRIVEDGFWIDRIKSKCYVIYETEDQAIETRHALHGVTWPVSNPKTLQVDFSSQEAFDKAKENENGETPVSSIPGTVEDWLREQDMKKERGDLDKPWEKKNTVREWDVGKNEKDTKERPRKDERALDRRRPHSPERSPEPAKKFKKKEEEAPAKLLDDLFRKTKTTPCIYWLPLSSETIAVKEEQRRLHMAEHERRMQELRRTHRRH